MDDSVIIILYISLIILIIFLFNRFKKRKPNLNTEKINAYKALYDNFAQSLYKLDYCLESPDLTENCILLKKYFNTDKQYYAITRFALSRVTKCSFAPNQNIRETLCVLDNKLLYYVELGKLTDKDSQNFSNRQILKNLRKNNKKRLYELGVFDNNFTAIFAFNYDKIDNAIVDLIDYANKVLENDFEIFVAKDYGEFCQLNGIPEHSSDYDRRIAAISNSLLARSKKINLTKDKNSFSINFIEGYPKNNKYKVFHQFTVYGNELAFTYSVLFGKIKDSEYVNDLIKKYNNTEHNSPGYIPEIVNNIFSLSIIINTNFDNKFNDIFNALEYFLNEYIEDKKTLDLWLEPLNN